MLEGDEGNLVSSHDVVIFGDSLATLSLGFVNELATLFPDRDIIGQAAGRTIDFGSGQLYKFANTSLLADGTHGTNGGVAQMVDAAAIGDRFSNVIEWNHASDILTGGDGDDRIFGHGGNDLLDGNAGRDLLDGGAGDDRIYVDNAADQIVEAIGGGSDRVYAGTSYTLDAGARCRRPDRLRSCHRRVAVRCRWKRCRRCRAVCHARRRPRHDGE